MNQSGNATPYYQEGPSHNPSNGQGGVGPNDQYPLSEGPNPGYPDPRSFSGQNVGFQPNYQPFRCPNCGVEMDPALKYCPNCGTNSTSKKKKTGLIVAIAIAAVVLLAGITAAILFISNSGTAVDFSELFSKYKGESWCDLASDGSYMELDTNPDDLDSDGTAYYIWYLSHYDDVNTAINEVNKALGFGEGLKKKMESTNALQGKQTEENDQYRVTWSYHPDHGLEVLYEVKGK